MDACIIVFVKYPAPGRVKTRLAETLGEELAASLYSHFVKDILEHLTNITYADVRICYDPAHSEAEYAQWLGGKEQYLPQQGSDIGERMKHAMQKAYADGYSRVVLMGSDIPDFPPELLKKTVLDLGSNDAVIGPALDGGYFLIGFREDAFFPEVFDAIPWSTEHVFQPTLERMFERDLNVQILPEWHDIDTIWDVNVLLRTNRRSSFRNSKTFTLLKENEALIRQYDVDLPKMS